MADIARKTAAARLLAVSNHDLAFAIMLGALDMRPPSVSINPKDALLEAAKTEPEVVAGFYRAAKKVAELLEREINGRIH